MDRLFKKLVKKIVLIISITSFIPLNGCDKNFSFSSPSISRPSSNSNNNNTDKLVRGPTGGGLGGGIIVVDNSGNVLSRTKYELYLEENYLKQKIQVGTTDKNGKINLDGDKLSDEIISRINDGSDRLIVEVYDADDNKSVAQANLFVNSDNQNS